MSQKFHYSAVQLRDFETLFSGRMSAYGSFRIAPGAETGKVKGTAATVQGAVTGDLYAKHLEGSGFGLGIVPIKENNNVLFAVIDVDHYTAAIKKRVLDTLEVLNAPLCVFTSKSGGLHIYIFFMEEVPAKFAITTMRRFVDLLSLDSDTEVFPKQAKLEEGQSGNWINLPYYNAGDDCKRVLLTVEGTPIYDFTVALTRCMQARVTKQAVEDFFAGLPLQDAPPCLQRVYLAGNTKSRNNYLFSIAHYFKAKYGDAFDTYVLEANSKLAEPLDMHEVTNTVIMSARKQDYSYACSQEPMKLFCDRKECAKRQFGIGSKEISNLSFGEFRQIMTDPPSYEWVVNEVVMKLVTEDEIINQNAFRRQSIRKLHIMPNKLNEPAWSDIVNRALTNVVVVAVALEDDISSGALITKYILEFLVKRSLSQSRNSVLRNMVYHDLDAKGYVFMPGALVDYLTGHKQLRLAQLADLKEKLTTLEGTIIDYKLALDSVVRCWLIPEHIVHSSIKPEAAEEKINFLNNLGHDAI